MKVKKMFPLVAVGLLALAGCNNKPQEVPVTNPAINLANLDSTVTAGEDFYQYACGGWMKSNPLTPEYSRYGIFEQLMENNNKQLKALVEELGTAPQQEGSVGQKIGMLYKLALDSIKTNEEGATPIKEELEAIRNLGTKSELSKMTVTITCKRMRLSLLSARLIRIISIVCSCWRVVLRSKPMRL